MWLFQGVLNAGLQILLSIGVGWLCSRLHLVDPEVMSRQLNAFAMRAAFPAFIIHLLGIKTDLQDLQAWRALAVFILWVFLIHLACIAWHRLRSKQSTMQHLGIQCLLLTTNNTGCIGWPVLIATVGRQGAALSMLLGVLFFVQLLPAAITCFEYQKWLDAHEGQGSASDDTSASNKAPVHAADTDKLLPVTAPDVQPTGFPHEFRYCYWSNADYVPIKKPSSTAVPKPTSGIKQAYPHYVEVCVDSNNHTHLSSSGNELELLDHHCFGGGRATTASTSSHGSSSSSSGTPAQPSQSSQDKANNSSGKEWWRTGPPNKTGGEQLKRAKDSCDSLYTPFAAAACCSRAEAMQQQPQVVQSPRAVKPGLANLTRRLSRTLSQQTAAAVAAASSAAGSVAAAAAAASPSHLVRAASLRKQQQRDPLCTLSVPLMSGHEGPASCQHEASSSTAGGSGATAAVALFSGGPSQQQNEASKQAAGSAAGSAAAAGDGATRRGRTLSNAASAPFAADSAVELHLMCDNKQLPTITSCGDLQHEQHLQQHLAGCSSSIVSNNSFNAGRPNSSRINSRTELLAVHTGFKGTGAAGARTKLSSVAGAAGAGTAGAVGAADAAVGLVSQGSVAQVPKSCFVSFMKNHPLLCHITVVQLKSFHLWLNLVAIALSVSGVRKYLDPESPAALPALGWVDGMLSWFSAACIPVLLFANGVWMVGKDVFGGKQGQLQVTLILLLKLSLLPALMVGLTQLFGMRDAYGLSLVLLTSCPLAPLAFLVCQQYGVGAELATSVTIQGVLLMLPQMMAIIKISQVAGLYDVQLLKAV